PTTHNVQAHRDGQAIMQPSIGSPQKSPTVEQCNIPRPTALSVKSPQVCSWKSTLQYGLAAVSVSENPAGKEMVFSDPGVQACSNCQSTDASDGGR
ncbi:hypothetical protein T310_8991, partial [Rasamsonia emersonii CBS 393.64]